ncbi:MAG: hypothetical protein ACREH5_09410 [Candidatus Omnitrophota bacterium]
MYRSARTLMVVFAVILTAQGAYALTEAERTRAIQETERGLRSVEPDARKSVVEPAGPRDVTGLEWLQMSIGERMDQLVMSLYVLEKYGYTVTKSPNDYYNALEGKLKLDPALYSRKLTNILAAIVGAEGD